MKKNCNKSCQKNFAHFYVIVVGFRKKIVLFGVTFLSYLPKRANVNGVQIDFKRKQTSSLKFVLN
jgi:hypothetical protein